MKILASLLLAGTEAWNLGGCSPDEVFGTLPESQLVCRNSCQFDWIGRGSKAHYAEFGKYENGFLASLSAIKWNLDYLSKDKGYIGMLRFDRNYCKRPILKAIGEGRVKVEVFDRTDENYMTEAQYWELPENGDKKVEAAFVQFRRTGYQQGEFLKKGKDRFFVQMTGVQKDFGPLDPPNDLVTHDDFYQCFKSVGLMTMADDQQGLLQSDYTRCAAFQRYRQTPNWPDGPGAFETGPETLGSIGGCPTPGVPFSSARSLANFEQWNESQGLSARIVGGQGVKEGEWPFIVGLHGDGNIKHNCGGTILTKNAHGPDFIVTAAHCFNEETKVNVTVGDWNQGNHKSPNEFMVEGDVIIHPYFDNTLYINNIAMIRVPNLSKINAAAFEPACLPTSRPAHGSKCYVAGWGTTEYLGEQSDILKDVGIWTFSDEYCLTTSLFAGLLGQYGLDTPPPMWMCAGTPDLDQNGLTDGGRDFCTGDCGGPLICIENDAPVLAAVTNFGNGCASEGWPGIFTDVAYNLEWIQSNIQVSGEWEEGPDTLGSVATCATPGVVLPGSRSIKQGRAWTDFEKISRISGGQPIKQGEWPFLVGLKGDGTNPHTCAGTILTKNAEGDDFILTTAFCFLTEWFFGISEVSVTIGDWNQFEPDENQFTVVGTFTIHPQYDFTKAFNDLAIIRVPNLSAINSAAFEPACLQAQRPTHGSKCYAAGWGTPTSGAGVQPAIAHDVALYAFSNEYCLDHSNL